MKKYMLIAVIMTLLSGCASTQKAKANEPAEKADTEQKKEADPAIEKKIRQLERLNDWFSYPLAQNKMQKTGKPIIQPYSRGGIYFEVYYDAEELKNYDYYDRKLHTDYGWKKNEIDGDWERTANSRTIQEGLLYINPASKAAIYYYKGGDGTFDVFKVRIKGAS